MSGGLPEAMELLARADLADRCRGVEVLAALDGEAAAAALVALLAEPSWYLRERVVDALAARPDAAAPVRRVLREGPWFARASACDVIGRRADVEAVDELLVQVEDRNVSLQKSALRALRSLAQAHGSMGVARRVAALPAQRRRRVLARAGHQEPRWAAELERALAGVPAPEFGGPEQERPARSAVGGTAAALVRFRRWLHALPGPGEARP